MFGISLYTYRKAKKLGVKVLPSVRKNKKIDIYKNGKYLTSIGDKRYFDYPMYLQFFGKEYANKRRRLYKLRHQKDRLIRGSKGWYADNLLW